jgi:dipeptidyl aminopeptidase/acylaminoacyl peptidase
MVFAFLVNPTDSAGQGTDWDYQRAAAVADLYRDKVFRRLEVPQWNDRATRLWYRLDTGPETHAFVSVDPEEGVRRPAFDHAAVARALSSEQAEQVGDDRSKAIAIAADRLPIESLELAEETDAVWRFVALGRRWRWDDRSKQLTDNGQASGPETPLADRGARYGSLPGRRETSVRFENLTSHVVELYWIEPAGELRWYGRLAPQQSRDQHTFAGHVWCAVGDDGDYGVFEATEAPGTVQIVGPARPSETRDELQRQQAATSPVGRWRASIDDGRLIVHPLGSEEPFELARPREAAFEFHEPFYWSPDESKLLVLEIEPGERRELLLLESTPRDQLQPRLHRHRYDKPGDRIDRPRVRLFDVANRREISLDQSLMPEPFEIGQVHWWPDSSAVTFLYNERGHQRLRLFEVDANDGATRVLIEETSPTFIDYAHKCELHYLDRTREVLWSSERDGWHHLYRWRRDGGQLEQLTRGQWVVGQVEHLDEAAGLVWFAAAGRDPKIDPYYRQLCVVPIAGGAVRQLTDGDGDHHWSWSPQRRWLIDRWSRIDQPPIAVLRDPRDGRLVCALESADDSALRAVGWRAPEPFVAPGRDGKTLIYGLIVRPSTMEPGRRYPVIEKIYAGPQGFHVPKSFELLSDLHELAELGFIVVQIDGMGTSGRSKAFHDVCWKNLADAGFPDRIAWLRAAAVHEPAMDLDRVGIFGGSAGGQNAVGALLAHGDFYRVAVADCGCHDNRLDKIWWNELWMGWPVGPHYEAQANRSQAARLQGKLLLVVGELDDNVDPASTMQLVDALIRADKDFDLLVIPGAGHGAAESSYGQRRRMDFFVRHLWGTEPRAAIR